MKWTRTVRFVEKVVVSARDATRKVVGDDTERKAEEPVRLELEAQPAGRRLAQTGSSSLKRRECLGGAGRPGGWWLARDEAPYGSTRSTRDVAPTTGAPRGASSGTGRACTVRRSSARSRASPVSARSCCWGFERRKGGGTRGERRRAHEEIGTESALIARLYDKIVIFIVGAVWPIRTHRSPHLRSGLQSSFQKLRWTRITFARSASCVSESALVMGSASAPSSASTVRRIEPSSPTRS